MTIKLITVIIMIISTYIIIIFITTEGHYYPLIIMKGQTAASAMAAEESVLQIHTGFTDQIIRAHQIMVKDVQRELSLQRERHGQFKHSASKAGFIKRVLLREFLFPLILSHELYLFALFTWNAFHRCNGQIKHFDFSLLVLIWILPEKIIVFFCDLGQNELYKMSLTWPDGTYSPNTGLSCLGM